MNQHTSNPPRPVVAFMTDFGFGDAVGVMKGVVLGIVPDVQCIDITHDIAPQDMYSGAWLLATSYRYFPVDTVFVCVVDPGVGSSRHPMAMRAGNWFFVGPDNGLFSYVLTEQSVHEVVALSNAAYHLPQVSTTFHGRDIFSPVAAHIASGVAMNDLGTSIDPTTLHRLDGITPIRHANRIEAHVVHIDHFGNIITSIPLDLVPDWFSTSQAQLTFIARAAVVTERRRFFADGVGDGPFIYDDSSGYLGIAVCNGNAARTLNVVTGTTITFVLTGE